MYDIRLILRVDEVKISSKESVLGFKWFTTSTIFMSIKCVDELPEVRLYSTALFCNFLGNYGYNLSFLTWTLSSGAFRWFRPFFVLFSEDIDFMGSWRSRDVTFPALILPISAKINLRIDAKNLAPPDAGHCTGFSDS